MPNNYFSNQLTGTLAPFQLDQIARVFQLHMASLLFKQDNPQTEAQALARLFHFGTEADMISRENIQRFQSPQWKMPFVSWAYGDFEVDKTKMSGTGVLGNYYSNLLGMLVSDKPMVQDITMIALFNTYNDYMTALKILQDNANRLIRLSVPMTINGRYVSFPIDLEFQITKGQFTEDFVSYMQKGNIKDLTILLKIHYHDILLGAPYFQTYYSNGISPNPSPAGIYANGNRVAPIDDIYLMMNTYQNLEQGYVLVFSGHVPPPLQITSLIPVDGATGISSSGSIDISFNIPVMEDLALQSLSIWPPVFGDTIMNSSGTLLSFTPRTGYQSGVTYTWACDTSILRDIYGGTISSGIIENTFTTV